MTLSRNPVLLRRSDDERLLALPTRRATTRLASWLSEALGVGDLLVLGGGLGVGKTFLTRALCRAYGVAAQVRITSPTFALANHLQGRIPIVHADLYRLGSHEEVLHLGLAEARERALLVAEWAEPYAAALGGAAVGLTLSLHARQRQARLWPLDAAATATFRRCTQLIDQRAVEAS